MKERCWNEDIWVRYNNESFLKTIFNYLGWIYSKAMGKKVLNEILAYTKKWYHYKLVIQEWAGSGCWYISEDRVIKYNLDVRISDPTYDKLKARNALAVYLYHELVHAYRDDRGEFKKLGFGKTLAGFECTPEEFNTVGLYEYADYSVSENALRKQLGLPRRPYYLTNKTGPSFIDEEMRRYFLMLPLPKKFNKYELVNKPSNAFTRKVNIGRFNQYILKGYFAREKKKWPKGFPSNLIPTDVARQNGYGRPLKTL